MTVALLDADVIAYRAAVVAEDTTDWGDGQEGSTVNYRTAARNAVSLTKRWIAASEATSALACFSHTDKCFRYGLFPGYKPGRVAKPAAYQVAREAICEEFKWREIPGLEADDVVGVIHTSPKFNTVAVSIDKDFRTLPGRLYDPVKRKWWDISRTEADRYWMLQTLIGDRIDGYLGCRGIGPKKAEKALAAAPDLRSMWATVVALFEKAGGTARDALLQAQLARILRREDFDRETGEITLWSPRRNSRR